MFNWFWKLLYNIMKAIFYCIDFMVDIAGMLCGIEPVMIEGEKQDIVYYFMTNDIVVDAFKAVLVIGFILLFIFTAYSVFRSMGRLGEGKSSIQICLDSAKTLLYFFIVPIVMVVGIVVVSTVMTSIYNATSVGESSLGGMLFAAAADGAWDGGGNKEAVLQKFINCADGYDYHSTGDVKKYFDLEEMDYFVGYVSGFAVLVLIALSLFSFVERAIGIVLLFIVSPLSMSTTPLDDGARFKLWRDQVINKYLIAYGSLLSINIFMLLVNTIQNVHFFDNSYLNQLAKVAFIIGGAFACRKGTVVVGNLINQGAGTADKMENSAGAAGVRQIAGMVAGATIGKIAHIAGMPLRHAQKDIKSAIHRQGEAKRSVKLSEASRKYSEKLTARRDGLKSKPNHSQQPSRGAASRAVASGASSAPVAGASGVDMSIAGVLKGTRRFDPNYQKKSTDSGTRFTEKVVSQGSTTPSPAASGGSGSTVLRSGAEKPTPRIDSEKPASHANAEKPVTPTPMAKPDMGEKLKGAATTQQAPVQSGTPMPAVSKVETLAKSDPLEKLRGSSVSIGGAVSNASSQSQQQTESPMNRHMQSQISGKMQSKMAGDQKKEGGKS